MSDYFPTVRRGLGDAVQRCAHLPWYRRMAHTRRLRVTAVVLSALVVATPAVGAVTNWFGIGAPNHFPAQSTTRSAGRALPGTSEMLSLRVADPQGGPAWGLRLVHTTRDDTCIQLGRVEDAKLGSLGIDDAWGNDHLFHPFPNTSEGEACGLTDAAGNGFVNVAQTGVVANANPEVGHGAQARSCRALRLAASRSSQPVCPAGSTRIVFMGLLGPDAASVTYEAPDHRLETERTSGPQGGYLLVFPLTHNTCTLYTTSPTGSYGPCGGTISFDGASPGDIGAIKAVTYKDGHTCTLRPSPKLQAAFRAFQRQVIATLGQPRRESGPLSPRWLAAYRRLLAGFLTREHLTETQFRDQLGPDPQCPPVGAVSPQAPKVTRSEIAAPVIIRKFPAARYGCPNRLDLGCHGISPGTGKTTVPIEWSFRARKAITSSRSWYEWFVHPPTTRGCVGGGSSSATYTNIRAGTMLHYSSFLPATCHGTYTITVGFEAQAPAGASNDSGADPGQDGSIIVGQASFHIP